jgi:hypothetical protein
MTLVVDLRNGHPVALAPIDEHDTERIVEWLKPLKDELGIEVSVTDDLREYRPVAEGLEEWEK